MLSKQVWGFWPSRRLCISACACHLPVGLCAIVHVICCQCAGVMVGVQGYNQVLG